MKVARVAPFRVGVMLDSEGQPFWIKRILEIVQAHPRFALSLVIKTEECLEQRQESTRFRKTHYLYNRFALFDKRSLHSQPEYFNAAIGDLVQGVPRMAVLPIRKGCVHCFGEEVTEKLRTYDLDLILRFGFGILRGSVLSSARYGIWSYHHSDTDRICGGPAGFWEVYEKHQVSGVVLQVLTETLGGGIILGKTYVRTDFHSPTRNRRQLFEAGIRLFEDAIEELDKLRPTAHMFFARHQRSPKAYSDRLYRTPTNFEMLKFLSMSFLPDFIRTRTKGKQTRVQWSIGFSHRTNRENPEKTLNNVVWLEPKRDRFWADPFPIKRDGRIWIFMEEYLYSEGKGRISVGEFNDGKLLTEPIPILERDFHLSFPYLFEDGGHLFMILEQEASRRIDLYECAEFPFRWTTKAVLLEGQRFVDPVLLRRGKYWWLFVTKSSHGHSENNLYIYFAETLLGTWQSHALNPVKNHLRGSRMAGPVFQKLNEIIRPAQNCYYSYGGSIVFYTILELTPEQYEEEEMGELLPSQLKAADGACRFNDKVHTFNQIDEWRFFDGSRMISC